MRYNRGWRWLVSLLGLLACLGHAPATPADDRRENDFQNWDTVTLTLPLEPGRKVLGSLEVQPRVGEDFSALIVRPAVGYQVHPKVAIWQGYAWAPVFTPQHRNENRLFQQVVMTHPVGRLTVVNRTRLEERFIQDTGGTSVRARHQLRLVWPLDEKRRWSAVLQDELFINLNSVQNGPHAGFDQNRAFAGINRKLGSHASAELGYLNAYVNRDTIPDRLVHALVFTLSFQVR